jgi:hypothetical protein
MFAQFYPSKRNIHANVKQRTNLHSNWKLKPVALIDEIIQNDKGGFTETTLKSKLILMIQLTRVIITCTTTVILIKFYKISM